MKTHYALILAVSIAWLLSGCATTDEGTRNERHVDRLMRHRSWPSIQQMAKAECKKRERLLGGWPDDATYLPMEHKDKLWSVAAMTGTPKGDVARQIILGIGDDGTVATYKRYWHREEMSALDKWP
jgi:hypothetical protein